MSIIDIPTPHKQPQTLKQRWRLNSCLLIFDFTRSGCFLGFHTFDNKLIWINMFELFFFPLSQKMKRK